MFVGNPGPVLISEQMSCALHEFWKAARARQSVIIVAASASAPAAAVAGLMNKGKDEK